MNRKIFFRDQNRPRFF